jgi:cytochrome c oxidase subunit 2
LVGVLALALLLAACQGEHPQSTIEPTTDFGDVIHGLYRSVTGWVVFIFVLVWVALGYILVRFRERPGQPKPKQIHGNMMAEIAWTIGPAMVVVAIAIPSIQAVFATQQPVAEDALVVNVTGNRFWWQFEYPEQGVTTANELHLPVDRPVSLRLQSNDVIHSFWVPRLGGKRDVNPLVRVPDGEETKYTWMFFTPREEGVFMGQCAEFCGSGHALMGVRAIVESEEAFQGWVGAWQTPSPTALVPEPVQEGDTVVARTAPRAPEDEQIALGRDVFHNQSFCTACHAINGTNAVGVIGPNLTRLGSRLTLAAGLLENTPENLVRWISDPQEVKPGALMPGVQQPGGNWPATNLTEDQVRAVAAYLTSLQ